MTVYATNPLTDARWTDLLLKHQRASVFHTPGWLSALQRYYEYTPVVFTTSPPDESLENGIVFCQVKTWITGQRLVSLPFSDHCDALITSPSEYTQILAYARASIGRADCKYVEVRPASIDGREELTSLGMAPTETFCHHWLSLDSSLEALFRRFHKDCIQRKIRRAEREYLAYEAGRSERLLYKFYKLQVRTRRRHGLPPQPLNWFRHLIASMGDRLTIRVASKNDHPVAALLTLSFKDTITYKYGCSDERFNHLGGTPYLFWKTIQEAKAQGVRRLDLGRSETDNAGLIQFKDRLGATRGELKYYRLVPSKAPSAWRMAAAAKMVRSPRATQLLRRLVRHIPDAAMAAAGRLLYRHFG